MYLIKHKKSPYYQILFIRDGKKTSISTKETSKSKAIQFLTNFKDEVKKRKEIKPVLLSQFKEEYVEFVSASVSQNYLRSVKLSFEKLKEYCGDTSIDKIDIQMIEKFLAQTYKRTKAGAALYYRTLKAAFSKAVLWNYIQENKFKKVKLPRIPKSHPVFISEVELCMIIEKTKQQHLRDIFLAAFHTGMRIGELVNLQWNHVDLPERIIKVKNTTTFTTKSKKERIIPINEPLLLMLKNRLPKIRDIRDGEYVFWKIKGIKLNENYVSKNFKNYARSAGMNEKLHFHSLRHSFASNLVQRGVSLYVVKELLGHEDLVTTQIYSHLQKNNLYEAVSLLNM